MRVLLGAWLTAALAFAGDGRGIKPHPSARDYPASVERDGAAVGATLLTADEVKGAFSTDLTKGYLVVEVGLYPKADGQLDVSTSDFVLRVAGKTLVRPASAAAVAANLHRDANPPPRSGRNIDIYPTATVGYESGPRTYDPVTGRQRGGGVYTSTGVGVGVGGAGTGPGSRPASTEADRRTMETELREKGVPEGMTSQPVAGYLIFPVVTDKKRSRVVYDLEYSGFGKRVALELKN